MSAYNSNKRVLIIKLHGADEGVQKKTVLKHTIFSADGELDQRHTESLPCELQKSTLMDNQH